MSFYQEPPSLKGKNTFEEDIPLKQWLERVLPVGHRKFVFSDLERFGARVTEELQEISYEASLARNKPKLVQINAWGKRVDQIIVSPEWKQLHRVAAEEGVIAIGYGCYSGFRNEEREGGERGERGERGRSEFSRLHQYVKLYLYCPVGALVTCPLAMTDGACRLLEKMEVSHPLCAEALQAMTSTDPEKWWTSGQWMTERTGGSDISNTETIAIRDPSFPNHPDRYLLSGYKFFTSATTSQVAFTLARVGDKKGSRGLSLFLVKLRDEEGSLGGLRVERLKDKLGTWQVPTAELFLEKKPALLVGGLGEGVKNISNLFNVTRIHCSISGVASMRWILHLARDYATKRVAFGKKLIEHPSHLFTLSKMEIVCRAHLYLNLETIRYFGLSECDSSSSSSSLSPSSPSKRADLLLRLLTPLCKIFTSKEASVVLTEGLECFGGAGYMEDTGIPGILRDQLVNIIWEGTTNVLSHDVMRALSRQKSCFDFFCQDVVARIQLGKEALKKGELPSRPLTRIIDRLSSDLLTIQKTVSEIEKSPGGFHGSYGLGISRSLAFAMAHSYASSCALEQMLWSKSEEDIFVTEMYTCEHYKTPHDLLSPSLPEKDRLRLSWSIVMNKPPPSTSFAKL